MNIYKKVSQARVKLQSLQLKKSGIEIMVVNEAISIMHQNGLLDLQ